jgi:hypothetical protein
MSRSGYSYCSDFEYNAIGLWRGAVRRAVHGKRGQAFLAELVNALDAMPVKELIAGEVVRDTEHVCALGSVALARKLDVSELEIDDGEEVGATLGIARALACEIAYENDEAATSKETPAERWQRMRQWAVEQIHPVPVEE